jgi:hypothetical protein
MDLLRTTPSGDNFLVLWEERKIEDSRIERLFDSNSPMDLVKILHYQDVNRQWREDSIGLAAARMFNHQVHHQWRLRAFLMSEKSLPDHARHLFTDFLSCKHFF